MYTSVRSLYLVLTIRSILAVVSPVIDKNGMLPQPSVMTQWIVGNLLRCGRQIVSIC
jgi:hypothetical protein